MQQHVVAESRPQCLPEIQGVFSSGHSYVVDSYIADFTASSLFIPGQCAEHTSAYVDRRHSCSQHWDIQQQLLGPAITGYHGDFPVWHALCLLPFLLLGFVFSGHESIHHYLVVSNGQEKVVSSGQEKFPVVRRKSFQWSGERFRFQWPGVRKTFEDSVKGGALR